jgi:N-ethylmaleimide reductase
MKLFNSFNLSGLNLSSRVVMAPLTRRRATNDNVPVNIMAEYYGQRAGAGLIIAEGTSPSPNGVGYCNMPALYNKEQMNAWRPTTKTVHDNGGKIFLQVMHAGRVGHVSNLPAGAKLFGPSAIAQVGEVATYHYGKQKYSVPVPMSLSDIDNAVSEFANCSLLAIEAGFDGVEIHGAHGYLPNQFINQSSNFRTDEYGGSLNNRLRFLNRIIDSTIAEIGSNKVSLRISPFSYADVNEDPINLRKLYLELVSNLNTKKLAYLHLSHMGEAVSEKFELWKEIRSLYAGVLMLCGDYTKEKAEQAIQNGDADLISFGRDFIANPDLVDRFKNNWKLMERDKKFWYTNSSRGYTDYDKCQQ